MRRGGDIAVSFARISDGLDQYLDPWIVPVNTPRQKSSAVMPAIHSPQVCAEVPAVGQVNREG